MPEIIPNLHPIFVHFTVALLSLSVALFVVVSFVKSPLKEQWEVVARWSLWFGAGITILTAIAGLYAYNTVAHDTPSHLAMTNHRNWAISTIIMFSVLTVWSIAVRKKKRELGLTFVICMIVAGVVLASTAWRGGEVVYRYGLGVMSLPKSEGEGHSHSHGGDSGHGHQSQETIKDMPHEHEESGSHELMSNEDMDFSGIERVETTSDDGHKHSHDE